MCGLLHWGLDLDLRPLNLRKKTGSGLLYDPLISLVAGELLLDMCVIKGGGLLQRSRSCGIRLPWIVC